MRKRSFVSGLVIVAAMAAGVGAQQKPVPKMGFTLSSPAFADGGEVPVKYTLANKEMVSPRLEWSNVPEGTQSFTLVMYDPDAAMRKSPEFLVHFMMLNIPGTARELPEAVPAVAQLPDGTIQPKNLMNKNGYLGPGAPAPGPHHHYMWRLFALDTKLTLGADATYPDVMKAMEGHVLATAVMGGRFHQ